MRDVLRRMARANRPHLHTLTPQQARAAYEAGAGVLEITPAPLPRADTRAWSLLAAALALLPLLLQLPPALSLSVAAVAVVEYYD